MRADTCISREMHHDRKDNGKSSSSLKRVDFYSISYIHIQFSCDIIKLKIM